MDGAHRVLRRHDPTHWAGSVKELAIGAARSKWRPTLPRPRAASMLRLTNYKAGAAFHIESIGLEGHGWLGRSRDSSRHLEHHAPSAPTLRPSGPRQRSSR